MAQNDRFLSFYCGCVSITSFLFFFSDSSCHYHGYLDLDTYDFLLCVACLWGMTAVTSFARLDPSLPCIVLCGANMLAAVNVLFWNDVCFMSPGDILLLASLAASWAIAAFLDRTRDPPFSMSPSRVAPQTQHLLQMEDVGVDPPAYTQKGDRPDDLV